MLNERTHRIELNPETKAPLHEIRDKMHELMKDNPEILGMTIYGSNIKGTARNMKHQNPSDLDGTVFINPGVIKQTEIKMLPNGLVDNNLPENLETHYKGIISNALGDSFPKYELSIRSINEDIASQMVQQLIHSGIKTEGNNISFQRAIPISEIFRFSLTSRELSSIRKHILEEIEKQVQERNEELKLNDEIIQIGDLQKVTQHRVSADDMWLAVADGLHFWEYGTHKSHYGPFDRDERFKKSYPQTIDQARKYYGITK